MCHPGLVLIITAGGYVELLKANPCCQQLPNVYRHHPCRFLILVCNPEYLPVGTIDLQRNEPCQVTTSTALTDRETAGGVTGPVEQFTEISSIFHKFG
jgi:hypothetical protein